MITIGMDFSGEPMDVKIDVVFKRKINTVELAHFVNLMDRVLKVAESYERAGRLAPDVAKAAKVDNGK